MRGFSSMTNSVQLNNRLIKGFRSLQQSSDILVDIMGGNSTDSQAVVLGSLINGALYVITSMRAVLDVDRGVTSITYGGVSLTKVADFSDTGITDRIRLTVWRLLKPASGSNTLVVTPSGTPQSKTYGWISLSSVNQNTPEDVIGTGATANSANISSSVTTVASRAFVIDVGLIDSGSATVSAATSQTSIVNNSNGSRRGFASYKAVITPPGATTMTWTASGSANWGAISISIKPGV